MATHLSALGFPTAKQEDLAAVVVRASTRGAPVQGVTAGCRYNRFVPGEGIELWVQMRGREIIGFNPHYTGKGRMRVGLTEIWPDPDDPMDGRVQGWVNPPAGDPTTGDFPLTADLPDFDVVRPSLSAGSAVTLQVAAFAHEIRCYDDDQAFDASQEGVKFAPESFLPAGMFGIAEGARPEAVAIFAGHIQAMNLITNPESKQPFWWMLVKTLGGTVDVVADPESISGIPRIGGVVEGHFWLSARTVQERSTRGIMPMAPGKR